MQIHDSPEYLLCTNHKVLLPLCYSTCFCHSGIFFLNLIKKRISILRSTIFNNIIDQEKHVPWKHTGDKRVHCSRASCAQCIRVCSLQCTLTWLDFKPQDTYSFETVHSHCSSQHPSQQISLCTTPYRMCCYLPHLFVYGLTFQLQWCFSVQR